MAQEVFDISLTTYFKRTCLILSTIPKQTGFLISSMEFKSQSLGYFF